MPEIDASGELRAGIAVPRAVTVTRPATRAPAANAARPANHALAAVSTSTAFSGVAAEGAELGVAEGPPEESGLLDGVAAFVQPPPMEIGKWYVIEFVAGPDKRRITEEAEDRTLTRERRIYVGNLMRVRLLKDKAFEITPKSDEEQETGADKTATWSWNVKPLASGKQTLQAEVDVIGRKADGTIGKIDGVTRRVDIEVKVNRMDEALGAIDHASNIGDKLTGLFSSWQKTIAALVALLGAIGLLLWKLGLKRAKPAD